MTLRFGMAAVFAAMMSAGSAFGATIAINDTSPASFTVDCPSGCLGILADGSTSDSTADAFEIGPASEDSIATYLTSLLGSALTKDDVTKFDVGTGGLNGSGTSTDYSFDVGAGIFFTKYATYTAFFVTDTAQTVNFEKSGGGKGALSNYGTVDTGAGGGEGGGGGTTPVPLPASALLMIAGLGGLMMVRRRVV